jgi:hypothetical protein
MMKRLIFFITFIVAYHIYVFPQKVGDTYVLNSNNVQLPLNSKGILADVNIPPFGAGGKFDSITVLFSAGFYLGGYNSDSLWANGVATAILVEDYLPGTVESGSNDPRAQLYRLNVLDEDFGVAWQDWISAVELGADFYDGDGDGVYNPVDLNGNGIWDPNEDAPDLIGDQTLWCVFNDGVLTGQRRWGSEPQGIEIYQTIFLDGTTQPPSGNIIYLRYRILNSGTVAEILDSVYFTAWADPDIGSAVDDLTGCDTLIQTGYTYNDSSDNQFGNDPPAVAIVQLQGPYAYIPGVTFIDINGNGVYDEGIDTPLTTAYNHRGQFLGVDSLPGATNLEMKSFMHSPCGSPTLCSPSTIEEARYRMLGQNIYGEYIDPCLWSYGEVLGGVNCAEVNPLFMFSGDPVIDVGWINTVNGDQKMTISTGPFQLEAGKPVDIILAYSVGRGIDPLNSVTETKSIIQYAISIYESNFDIETSVDKNEDYKIPSKYYLSQNYANPFNPNTTIKYQIPELSFITLKVYDVLGSEITTLVNEEKPIGGYEIKFDATGLPSGIYFYQLQAGDFVETKKMILMK